MAHARNGAVELWYETFGDTADPTLLMINGLGSQCINFDAALCERLAAEGLHVVRFDNRDMGRSTWFDEVAPDVAAVARAVAAGDAPEVPYTLSDMAADAVAVLDELGVESAHVFGVSMGGMIAQAVAIEHADRVRSLISVMSTTGDRDVGQSSTEARALLMSPPPTDRESAMDRAVEGIRTWGSPEWFDEERVRATAAAAFDRAFHPAGTARQMMAITAAPSRTAALGSVAAPTLVIHGDVDTLVDASGGRRTAEAIPGARLELVAGMGHDYPPPLWDRLVGLVVDHTRAADTAVA
ncbi:MAG TPA: alpha/beta fold hydrolase [Acidimicrobiales bacterium]|nr:alpha/beta fold hydrolase [Acidimicrobiales bacterium]